MSPREGYYLPERRLVAQQDASIVTAPDVPRSRFTNQWSLKTAFDAGYLVPIEIEEVLPGDHFQYDVTALVRMSTPLFPILDSQRIDTFFFFVPARLLWSNWEEFNGQQATASASIVFTVPTISIDSTIAIGSIYDYAGLPIGNIAGGQSINVNALPFRAYNLIYQEWFRDQNTQTINYTPSTGNGPDAAALYSILRRAKSHDYFTSCLPWAQKFTAPTVPVSGTAPIIGIGFKDTAAGSYGSGDWYETGDSAGFPTSWQRAMPTDIGSGDGGQYPGIRQDTTTGMPLVFADLAQATGVAINTFRLAFMTQQLLEKDARYGTRYTESIWAHFRVRNPDYRLQRPEYIGGGQSPLVITPIAQTGVDSADEGLGALGGAGTAAGTHRASYAATEHGYIIGLANVKTELSYQQGLRKLWTRSSRYDFYVPSFAGLGEQAVLLQELYCTGDDTNDTTVFGYQERWHEYRTRYSQVTGIMRSNAAGTLDAWHFAQDFSAPPALNTAFLNDTPDMNRVLAAGALSAGQQYLADIHFRRTVTRALPMFGTPVTLGRF